MRVSVHISEGKNVKATRRLATQRDESVHLRSPSVISPSRPSSSTLASLARKLALCDQASDSLRRVRRPSLRPSVRPSSLRPRLRVRPSVRSSVRHAARRRREGIVVSQLRHGAKRESLTWLKNSTATLLPGCAHFGLCICFCSSCSSS